MNGIINKILRHPSFAKYFFFTCVAILIATLIKVFVWIPPRFGNTAFNFLAKQLIAPSVAGGITVSYGINDFQGTPYPPVEFLTYATTYCSLIFTFVFGPVTFLAIRKRVHALQSIGKGPTVLFRTGYILYSTWLIFFSGIFIASAIGAYSVQKTMWSDNTISKYRDDVITEMYYIRSTAQLYYLLPVNAGGGGRSFLKNGERITLSDLRYKEVTPLGRFLLYHQRSDTILYLHFIGNKMGTLVTDDVPDEINPVEFEMMIMPSSYYLKTLH